MFESPATTIAVVEAERSKSYHINIASAGTCNADTSVDGQCLWAKHLQTSNFLFADGHAKAMRPLQTIQDGVIQWYRQNRFPTSTPAANIAAVTSNLQAAENNAR